jgi:hypothetical protein
MGRQECVKAPAGQGRERLIMCLMIQMKKKQPEITVMYFVVILLFQVLKKYKK